MADHTQIQRTRYSSRRVPRHLRPWDHPHLLLWGGLLVLLLLTPLMSIGGITVWTWDVFGGDSASQFATPDPDAPWERTGPTWSDTLNALFPHLFGGLALALLYFCRPTRLRGQVLAAVGVGYLLLNLTGARLNAMLPMRDLDVAGWSLLFGVLVGPPLLAAGNRVQRREEVTGLPLVLAIAGGAMIVTPFFNQVGDNFIIGIFLEDGAWEVMPLLLLLLFTWLCLGLAGLSLLFPGIRRTRGAIISRLLRVCLWSAPIIIIVTLMGQLGKVMGGGGSLAIAWFMLRAYLLYAGIIVLIAIGLARILEAPAAAEEPDIEGAVRAF